MKIGEEVQEVFYRFFLTIVSLWKSVRPIPGLCRRWWAISLIPRSCVRPRCLPGRLCPRLRSFFPLQELSEPKSLKLASRLFPFLHSVLIDCWPSESPFTDVTADHDENQRKLDRRLKSICITIESLKSPSCLCKWSISSLLFNRWGLLFFFTCIVVRIWASLYCLVNSHPRMYADDTHFTFATNYVAHLKENMNDELTKITEWLASNKLTLKSETEFTLIGSRQKLNTFY